MAYIPFKINSTSGETGSVWEKLYHFYAMHKGDFEAHYHRRSNVESVFSMVKAKFRDHVRSKDSVAMTNEVLCKLICHNICCLIMSQLELGIEPVFWEEMLGKTEARPAFDTPTTAPTEGPLPDTLFQMGAGA
jgi:hypothetical protein